MTNVARFTIEKIEDFVKSNTKLELQIHELTDMMNRITVHDNVMREYSLNLKTLEQNTIVNFAEFIVSPNSIGVQALLDRIHLLMTGTADLRSIGSTGLFNLIGKNMQVSSINQIRKGANKKKISIFDDVIVLILFFFCLVSNFYFN